ncbi:DUF6064 family protein [Aliifodinibius sp. S!AR15-10]|uniref:DUF6064 family protein n=1 Tax=Aliifodinibius sp. S!AR15-10 TaxID=2950437 RepID=UPI00286072A6|nr:DUF6064 family protein [Aliifodinibius sp. S!AR15-10]MDR8393156.1 DUF6064 family protein [Aliifodinibius sp. S!AR15-10]
MMELPFTTDQFLELFKTYNTSIWPAQVVAYLMGGLSIYLAFQKTGGSDRMISLILSAFWLWMGTIYHLTFFTSINTAAYGFGTLFIIQGLLFLGVGVWKKQLKFQLKRDVYGFTGAILILYAMVIYPLIGAQLGHGYPYAPMFGVTPCPATIFTFGILLWTAVKVPWWILLIPGIWSVIGFTAAIKLGILEDTGLFVAGILGIILLSVKKGKEAQPLINKIT